MQATSRLARACSRAPQQTGGEGWRGKTPAPSRTPQAERDSHTPSSTPTAFKAASPKPPLAGTPSSASDRMRWEQWGQVPRRSRCCRASLTHARAHTRPGSPQREKEQGWEGTAGAQVRGRPGSPVIPSEGEMPPHPGWCQGGARLPRPGNTCSHFYQGMFTRRQPEAKDRSSPPPTPPGDAGARDSQTLPLASQGQGGKQELGKRGAHGGRRGRRGLPAPHPDRHFFLILGKMEGRGARRGVTGAGKHVPAACN